MAKFHGMRPLRKGPLPFRYVFLLSFVMFMFSTAFGLYLVNKGIEPTLIEYAELETKRVANLAINKAINQKLAEGIDVKKLFITEKDNDNVISLVNPDTAMILRVQSETTLLVHKYLKLAEAGKIDELEVLSDIEIEESEDSLEEGFILEIPLGQATKMAILGNLGPKIPVKFTTVGEAETNVIIDTIGSGINNTQIIISIEVIVNVQVIIPFATELITVKTKLPIGAPFIQGKVPQFYNGAGGEGVNPSIEINPN